MDQAKTSLDVARTTFEAMKAEHPNANVTFVHAPIERLPLADASLDAVLLFNVLEEMPDMRAAFREVCAPFPTPPTPPPVNTSAVPADDSPSVLALPPAPPAHTLSISTAQHSTAQSKQHPRPVPACGATTRCQSASSLSVFAVQSAHRAATASMSSASGGMTRASASNLRR